ncbi:Gamma-glutamyl-putrescine synthetase [Klebsiella pneumoniae ISC21]|nr:Gamma-glutamyl-putrescine synthetase [Klebsiella pneumoniae ISC21]
MSVSASVFCHVFHACKHDELLQFERLITETEIEWMLKKNA